jgi:hypothetical protein
MRRLALRPSCTSLAAYSVLSRPSALARRPEAVEADWKYRPRVGARKDRKRSSAPLCCVSFQVAPDRWQGAQNLHHDIPESREREPEEEDELEDVVEGEPVDNLDEALEHGEEGENDPILKNALAAIRDQCATGSIQGRAQLAG